jgi:hypothetical protein
MTSQEPFWYDEPSVLFAQDTWSKFVPQPTMTVPEALNTVARFSIYLSLLLFVTTMRPSYMLIIPLVLGFTVVLKTLFPQARKLTEPFVSSYVGEERTLPTPDNPFMNAPLTDILDNPNRPPAAEVTSLAVRDKVNAAFAQTSNLYMDTSDLFDLVQSQRNFHTVPEDDHAGLLKFLGKNGQYSNQKGLSETYVVAKGTVTELPTPTPGEAPSGTAPVLPLA